MLRKKQMAPKDFDASAYVTRRIFAPAPDGESVPISILHRRDAPLDGTAPLLVYGYGAYGHVIDASFSTNRLSLVDRGFVYAIAHIRGGTDKGWRWYEEGKLARKTNTFEDFIAATQHLIAHGFGAPRPRRRPWRQRRRHADGRDRQQGAASFTRHHRRRALRRCAQHDARRQPAADAAGMAGMGQSDPRRRSVRRRSAAIRPYDNVAPQRYPAILALAGPDRSARHLLGAGEMGRALARDRDGRRPDHPENQYGAGHAGASGRFDQLEDIALAYAFALTCVNRTLEKADA